MSGSKIAFVLTGSIAAYKACDAISRLVQAGHSVRAVASASALRFVGAATLEGLTGQRVLTDLFEEGAALEHIQLTRWADAVVVCPCTANTLNKFAAGLADDLVGALYLAHDRSKPFLVAPAMNPAMWQHPATQDAVEKLGRWGVRLIPVGEGRTACGETGDGRLAEPAQIAAFVEACLARPSRRLKVLVTSGGTSEPIDGVRVISNRSTGRTGALIASRLARSGHDVVHLRAGNSVQADACRDETFESFSDLESSLGRLLGAEKFDAVVHAAAVGDFSVASVTADGKTSPFAAKLGSHSAPLIQLRANPKLVDGLRRQSANADLTVVAFKLTNGAGPGEAADAVASLFDHSGADFVVHNDATQQSGPEAFPSAVHSREGTVIPCATRTDLAEAIQSLLTEPLGAKPIFT
ncbi:MAG TPA: bifunctional phosphopantothenoylcysteine decarboxylase/phosphopantothenate--cysteine ligase CoaBC [Opitutaceae bacterium]|jgi:phosphopantothenoylcysteine decarboxylase/phosphopantothenate--cysteine ligase|nr:bifunctional phosphopantothenoylcysteine decarboxylase/phosphopantothenate--cysteine ligase CoaBC [Opitutaceae bacterium]